VGGSGSDGLSLPICRNSSHVKTGTPWAFVSATTSATHSATCRQ
jgi:hypothetical protein